MLIDGPFGDYEKLVQEGHETVNFYVNGEVIRSSEHAVKSYILRQTPDSKVLTSSCSIVS